jgi:hypothetical protein
MHGERCNVYLCMDIHAFRLQFCSIISLSSDNVIHPSVTMAIVLPPFRNIVCPKHTTFWNGGSIILLLVWWVFGDYGMIRASRDRVWAVQAGVNAIVLSLHDGCCRLIPFSVGWSPEAKPPRCPGYRSRIDNRILQWTVLIETWKWNSSRHWILDEQLYRWNILLCTA